MRKIITVIFLAALFSVNSFAQFTDFHPELKWYTIKGKYCEVHFHDGADRTARVVAKIADEVIPVLESLYDYNPGTIHYVIKDIDDYSNGATYFFDNKIEIWTSALDFDLRGAHNWLRNVISHETTHMVQIQSALKMPRTVPAFFLQLLNYEDERRPDILYGYPNVIVSYPIAGVNVPSWFAEGTAQYMRKEFNYDNWDTHRDMVLRCYSLDGNMLTWNQMGVFDKTSLGNESVYNSGFALTRYISQKYGEEKLEEISHALGKAGVFTIDAAFKDVLGKDGNQIYDEWRSFVTKSYRERIQKVLSDSVQGKVISGVGFGNFYPTFSPDGSKFVYISNKNNDYFSIAGIYLFDLKTNKEKEIVPGVNSTISWVPGKNEIIYSKLSDDNPNWYNVHDIYTYKIDEDKETRLTHDLRANQPSVSNNGKKIVFIFEKDGTTNLGTVDINGKDYKQVTKFNNGEQVYEPKFSPDDKEIIFDYSYADNRSIATIDTDGSNFNFLIKNNHDNRNAAYDKNGNIVFCSDSTGIFNLYSFNIKTGEKKELTNVVGGTFMPTVDSSGNILYAGYTSKGFKIFQIKPEDEKKVKPGNDYVWIKDPPLDKDKPKGDLAKFDMTRLLHYNDYNIPDYKKEDYTGTFTKLSFYPFIRFDNYNTTNNFFEKIKPGVYVSSTDMLNRYSLFAGADINSRLERDLFFIFNYRNKIPLLYDIGIKPELSLEVYNISRVANSSVNLTPDTSNTGAITYEYTIPVDVSYNLFEFDLAASQRIFSREQNLELRFIFSTYNADLSSFILPGPDASLYPATSDNYLIGRNIQLKYTFDGIKPAVDDEINPIGMQLDLTYNYEFDKFNPDGNYTVSNGFLEPVFNNYDFNRLELNSKIHFPLWDENTLTAQFRFGAILGKTVPDFFDYYLGGMIGMKAYPFYAVSGNKVGWLNLTYRFPLFKNIDERIGHLYIDKIFMSFYGDVGNAWNADATTLGDFKKGAGTEIRIHMNSYYEFPTDLFFNAAYGFDKFSRNVNGDIISYGREWRFYGGIMFGFDI